MHVIAFFFFARAAGREIRGRWQEREGSDTKWVQTRKDWQRKNIQQKQRFKWIPGVQFFYYSQPLHLHWMVIPRDHCNSGIKQVEPASLSEQGFNTKVALLTSITFCNSFSRFYRNHWNFYMTTASNRCVKITQAWNNWAAITRWKLLFATLLPNKVRHLQQLQWLSIQQYMAQQLTNRTIINVSLNPVLQTPHKHTVSPRASYSNCDSVENDCSTFLSHSFSYAMWKMFSCDSLVYSGLQHPKFKSGPWPLSLHVKGTFLSH